MTAPIWGGTYLICAMSECGRPGPAFCFPLDDNDRLNTVRTAVSEADEFVLFMSGPHIAAANDPAIGTVEPSAIIPLRDASEADEFVRRDGAPE